MKKVSVIKKFVSFLLIFTLLLMNMVTGSAGSTGANALAIDWPCNLC